MQKVLQFVAGNLNFSNHGFREFHLPLLLYVEMRFPPHSFYSQFQSCFNPPFSKKVSKKIGHYFLNLSDKHFPKNHKFHSIFKVRYSCTKNIKSIITNHNKIILNKSETLNERKHGTALIKTHGH